MTKTNIEKLRKEVEDLERQLAGNPFGDLFDRTRVDQVRKKLKKKRKELAALEPADTSPASGGDVKD